MSDTNNHSISAEAGSSVEATPDQGACLNSTCCPSAVKLALYIPFVLVMGGLGALAAFPELADYGYPLIGNPSRTGFAGVTQCPVGQACSTGAVRAINLIRPQSTEGCAASSVATARTTGFGAFNCCAEPESCPASSEAKTLEVAEVTNFQEETPADASSAANVIESEVSSN